MKIICIGKNYNEHIIELDAKEKKPENPVFFLKPETAITRNKKPFFYPHFSEEVHYELEVMIRICRLGKNIQTRFAHKYYQEVGLGIDFTARDLQKKFKQRGYPWEAAKAFDGSAFIGDFIDKRAFPDMQNLSFQLELNNIVVQKGNTSQMIFSVNEIISYVSQFVTLKIGDIIFTGTPKGVGEVQINDSLIGTLEGKELLRCKIK